MACFLLYCTIQVVGFSELNQLYSSWFELFFSRCLIILECIFGCFFFNNFFLWSLFYFLVWFTWYHLPFFLSYYLPFFFIILLNKISLFNLTRFINQIVTFSYLLKIHLWPLSNFFNEKLNCFFLDCET
jgi:hypothetical protein